VKKQLILIARGGRQQRRRCLGCGKQGVHCEVYVTYKGMAVGGDTGEGCVLYWTCPACHQQGLTPALEAMLLARREGRKSATERQA
jgi:hypothetical protein